MEYILVNSRCLFTYCSFLQYGTGVFEQYDVREHVTPVQYYQVRYGIIKQFYYILHNNQP